MKLSDVMSAADLAIYAEVGLVLFLLAFVGVLIKVMLTKSESYDSVRAMVLDDEGRTTNARSMENRS